MRFTVMNLLPRAWCSPFSIGHRPLSPRCMVGYTLVYYGFLFNGYMLLALEAFTAERSFGVSGEGTQPGVDHVT